MNFLDLMFGDRAGFVAVAFGTQPYRDDKDRYRHKDWRELRFRWPAERVRLQRTVEQEIATGEPADVYVAPALRVSDARNGFGGKLGSNAAPPCLLWADLDGEVDLTKLAKLDAYLVDSGQPGHRHLYLFLDRPVDVATHRRLNKALAGYLGADAKWSDDALLRLPGTQNWKPTVPPTGVEPGPARPVRVAKAQTAVWTVEKLAALLKVDLDATTSTTTSRSDTSFNGSAEPAPDPLPGRVRWALDHPGTADRSAAHARLVGACFDAGLTTGQALTVCGDYGPSVEKYAGRLADEVARMWVKLVADRRPADTDPSDGLTATKYESNEGNEGTNKNPGGIGLAGPTPHPAMFHGVLGDVVKRLEPATEADPVAMLGQLIAYSGALLRDRAHTMVGGSKHPPRVWPLIIGKTSAGRKGESRAQVRSFVVRALTLSPSNNFVSSFDSFNSYFVREYSGMSTGEGLLTHLTDREPGGDGEPPKWVPITDAVVITETEFARPLAAGKRENNTLSPILRDLWDAGRGQIMTKGEPIKVHGAFLVVIGHITPRELRLKLSEADIAGGLMNRYLSFYAHRSKLLADQPEPPDIDDLGRRFKAAIDWSRSLQARRIARTDAANQYWRKIYHALAAHEPDGMIGELLARAPAYVLRVALVYALMDRCTSIRVEHLRAGLALVAYSINSIMFVFGTTGDTGDLGRLAAALQKASDTGLTRSEISQLFGRNRDKTAIDAMVNELVKAGHAHELTPETGERGRPAVRMVWIGPTEPVDPLAALLDLNIADDQPHETNEENHATPYPAEPPMATTDDIAAVSAEPPSSDQSATANADGRACTVCGDPLPATASAAVAMHAHCYRASDAA